MNREILSKAKRVDNGEWVEGYVVVYPSGKTEIHKKCAELPDVLLVFEVDPETLCQYICLNDKNRKKIWENDIIRYNGKLFIVKWSSDCAHFAAYPVDKIRWTPCVNIGTMNNAETVGNIFDNPELLERGLENGGY